MLELDIDVHLIVTYLKWKAGVMVHDKIRDIVRCGSWMLKYEKCPVRLQESSSITQRTSGCLTTNVPLKVG